MRFTTIIPALLALVALACGGPAGGRSSGVTGSEADVATPLGMSGAHIVTRCPTRLGRVVRGLGAEGYRGVDLGLKTRARFDAIDALMTEQVLPAVGSVRSRWGSGVGMLCDASLGGVLFLSDWRDVDATVEAVTRVLESQGLGEGIGIEISSVPVPE